jgi:DNA (cytosine-5)-methyltransferase 1
MVRNPVCSKTLIDLFCGCGGASIGFRRAGFDIKLGVDLDQLALRHYEEYLKVPTLAANIMTAGPDDILKAAGMKGRRPDVVIGCPPCQGFSRLSKIGDSDPRNALVERVAEIVEGLGPTFIAFENVPGLDGKEHFLKMTSMLTDIGYLLDVREVEMDEYGVPQRRRRLVCVGANDPKLAAAYRFPRAQYGEGSGRGLPKATVRERLHGLPPLKAGERSPVRNHSAPAHGDLMSRRISAIPHDGGSRSSLPEELQYACHVRNPHAGFHDVLGRMSWDKPSPTITTGCYTPSKGRFLHPEQDRGISMREAARLQTFPDRYRFPDERTLAARMIGNALPPLFAQKLGRSIMNALGK